MESVPPQKQTLVSSFLEIAVGQTAETALQFLQATNWKLEEAIQLFYVGNDGVGGVAHSQSLSSSLAASLNGESSTLNDGVTAEEKVVQSSALEDEVRPPLPVKREVWLCDCHFRIHS
ncbi:hypothetical protein ZOSMA_87G00430 [Zostera marina]|uniref:UBX domain-containing protein n=1 Tax=Zostera marina TaxID=29655 RepID=A0A0K9NKJ5_ZOSMR|nr:hypothetical protein ZOSMA_87G00430 [Zostera marina]